MAVGSAAGSKGGGRGTPNRSSTQPCYLACSEVPAESDYRTLDNLSVRLAPELDPRWQATQLSLKAVSRAMAPRVSGVVVITALLCSVALGVCLGWWVYVGGAAVAFGRVEDLVAWSPTKSAGSSPGASTGEGPKPAVPVALDPRTVPIGPGGLPRTFVQREWPSTSEGTAGGTARRDPAGTPTARAVDVTDLPAAVLTANTPQP